MSKHRDNELESEPEILSEIKPVISKPIASAIKNLTNLTSKMELKELLVLNPFERMVPFNLWFQNSSYSVKNHFQFGQNMRLRYYKSLVLTPIVDFNDSNLEKIKPFLPVLSLYQPFYPETFFSVWEFLQMKHIDPKAKHFLHIGREEKLGTMEAIIFYHERYQQTYQQNVYHAWLSGIEMYDIKDNSYNLTVPSINYLEQAYKIKFIRSTNETITYDFISIDCLHLLKDVFKWDTEELDLHGCLFYFLTSLKHINKNGSMLIRLNMIGADSWKIIFDIAHKYFKEYDLIRPSVTNPLNSEIYLFLSKFNANSEVGLTENRFLANLYRQKVYKKFYLNIKTDPENPITKKYDLAVKNWTNCSLNVLNTPKKRNEPIDCISQWHESNNLKQIKDMKKTFDDKAVALTIKTAAKTFEIKPVVPEKLYGQECYKKLIEKRAELNYYKRVMDTKPSKIFSKNRYSDRGEYFLTWEQLTNELDIYGGLKYILKKQYNAQMVTNAWIKMYEILNMFPDLIPSESISQDKNRVKTFHLCEAPGAFISAVNHYVTNRQGRELEWYAQTLVPTRTGSETDAALEDHFGLIAANPDKWIFGDPNGDHSGDITHSAVIKYYASNPLLRNIDFITADAGLQCDPTELNEQEAYLGKINMGQILCILACLPVGKSALFKTFLPMSEPLSISLVYLLTHLFTTLNIVKPSTSHSLNSEVYIVLRNYKGIHPGTLQILLHLLDDPKITSKSLLFNSIDAVFFKSYMENAGILIDRQIQSLNRNYYYYYHLNEIPTFKKETQKCVENWLNETSLNFAELR